MGSEFTKRFETVSDPSHAFSGIAVLPRRLAQIAFFATLVLIPIRLRFDLLSRPELPGQTDYTDFLLFAPDIAMLATIALWGISLLVVRRRMQLGPLYLWLPLAGLSLAGLVSAAASVDRALTLYHTVRLAGLFLFFLYVVNEIAGPALALYAIAFQGVIQALVAIAQFLSQRDIGLQLLGEHALDPASAGISIVSTGSVRVLRAYGLSDHPNILGGCLAFGLVLLLAAYLWTGSRTRPLLLISMLPMSLALLLTFSRSAWLAFAAGAAFLLVIQVALRRWSLLKPLPWLLIAVGLTLAPFVWKERTLLGIRLNTGGAFDTIGPEQQSIGERVLLVQAAGRIFAANALTGVGLGTAPIAMRNENPASTLAYQPPHMALLEAAMETGLPGGVLYFLLLVLPWLVFLRHRALLAQPWVAGAAALLLAVTVVGFFDYYTWLLVPGRLWQWLSWGLVAASVRSAD